MKVKMTIDEVYHMVKNMREARDINARVVAGLIANGNPDGAKVAVGHFKKCEEKLERFADIEVEFDN